MEVTRKETELLFSSLEYHLTRRRRVPIITYPHFDAYEGGEDLGAALVTIVLNCMRYQIVVSLDEMPLTRLFPCEKRRFCIVLLPLLSSSDSR